MPRDKDLKRLIRDRMADSGQRYTEARAHLLNSQPQRRLKSWIMAGSNPGSYEFGLDQGADYKGSRVVFLQSRTPDASGFGTMMQVIAPDDFRDKRVRLSGFVWGHDVSGWAGLWMRVDGQGLGETLGLDDMSTRPLTGSFDWRRAEVVLDVPGEARLIAFGALLHGPGLLRLADLRFEAVSSSVPTTAERHQTRRPQNLDFSELV